MAIDLTTTVNEMDHIPVDAPGTNFLDPPETEATKGSTETKLTVTPKDQSAPSEIISPSALESTDTPPPIGEGVTPGSFSVPRAGSRVWIFFHGGDIQKPVYFAQSIIPTGYTDHYSNPAPDPVFDPVSVITNNGSDDENTQSTKTDTVTDEIIKGLIVEPQLPI